MVWGLGLRVHGTGLRVKLRRGGRVKGQPEEWKQRLGDTTRREHLGHEVRPAVEALWSRGTLF